MAGKRQPGDSVSGPFSCRSICEDGHVKHCDVLHRTLGAARKCIHSGEMRPSLFKRYRGEIVFRDGSNLDKVFERYRSEEHAAHRGSDISLSARWVLDVTPQEAAPEAVVVRPHIQDAARTLADHLNARGLLSSIGIGGSTEEPVIYAYVPRKITLDEWSGYPVVVRRVGKIVPLSN